MEQPGSTKKAPFSIKTSPNVIISQIFSILKTRQNEGRIFRFVFTLLCYNDQLFISKYTK